MYSICYAFVFIVGICISDAGYGIPAASEMEDAQSDVEAPAYVPSYAKNFRSGYGSKNAYSGTKTGYTGTKTSYTGTKTGYTGTKTGYTGTKTGYTGTKTGYTGTKNGYSGSPSKYTETKTWYTNTGSAPSYQDLQHNANMPYKAGNCQPECRNGGFCLDSNTCHCPANYHGKACEFEKKPCLTYPPLPINSRRKCTQEFCTISCIEGHKFIDGSTVANMRCVEGQWQPTRADFTSIPDCEPECSQPCLNGGICLAVNTCQCPTDYRGPQCQYSQSACDFRKLAFNGNYKCKGDSEKFSCVLECPAGAAPSAPFADEYVCLYATGQFTPAVPHCVFNEVVIVTPSNHHSGYSNSYYETYYHNESEIHSQTSQNSHSGHSFGYGKHGVTSNVNIVVQDFTPKGGTCLTWAGVHYKTFDGKIYSFESQCQHILLRDAKDHKYTVAMRQGKCERKHYCPLELTIYLEDKPYILAAGEEEGTVVFRNTRRLIPIPATLLGLRVTMTGSYVVATLDAVGVTIKWDLNDVVVIEGSVLVWNNTEGLCGSLDGNMLNDFLTKEGTPAKTEAVLAASWEISKIGETCESSPTEPAACASKSDEDMKKALQFCTKVFSKEKFRKCSEVMDVTQLLETCQWDYCACTSVLSPEECACDTVMVYAKECHRLGVDEIKDWRDADTCPMQCPPGKLYKPCGPDVQPSCRFPEPASDNASCVEGCFCPAGLLLEGGKCIPQEQCPCLLRNKRFEPGSVVAKDCNTCTCARGGWGCTAAACGARCGAVGDPHYTTFDGRRYDFMGRCSYTMLRADGLAVDVENVACAGAVSEEMNLAPSSGVGQPSCTKAVNLKYAGVELHLKQGGLVLANGKEVAALPVQIGDVIVRAASSLFLIVQLPNGVDLWWDGNTRVFIDVPPEFHGKTKGLCGTFNQNQKDDFLTPEGDTEQTAAAFANKWKTRELCADAGAAEPAHPCQASPERRQAAEEYCAKLKSKLFEPCHWFVSVTPFYEECLYDMCACTGDAARCLCPVLGDYGTHCAAAGAPVQWRYGVRECELKCSGGQEYTVCADSCQRSCADVALRAAAARCRPRCVEGCACPAGQLLDANNVCVHVGQCPCFHKGMQFDAGYKEVRAGRRERELCTCVGARWDCIPASPEDIRNYPPAEDLRSNCSAAAHKEFTSCQLAEPLTCKNMHLPPSTPSAECRPGCQCKQGFVLDAGSGRCVRPAACPCHHGGRSFPDGHEMREECNRCTCVKGNWTCTELQCAGECSAWGDSHFTTFDGREYEFEGVCSYLLAKGCVDASDGFEVQIQNAPCGTTGATCSKSVTLKVGNGRDEETASLTRDAPLPDLSKLQRIKLRIAGSYVFLDVPSLGISLQWDHELRVYVKVDPMWRNRVKGLCGNYNSDARDDFQTPGGGVPESSPLLFADSWKLSPTCPKPTAVQDHCAERPARRAWAAGACGALKRHPFSLCHGEVPPAAFAAACERDACACDAGGDCRCACAALAAYAQRCAARGVVLRWRTQERCPMQCDETCASYEPCMSACPRETCDNTHYYKEILPACQRDACVEGCKPSENVTCPEGQIPRNASSTECVPRAQCKPVCMTRADGSAVLEGELLEQDACHACRCSKRARVCSGQPCPPDKEPITLSTQPPLGETTPQDEPLKCVSGWTPWVNRARPETDAGGYSVDTEPLPQLNELEINQPMCAAANMTKIECRTAVNHHSPKETRLDVECSLERGLVCRELGTVCPDFEIRVFCSCDKEEGRAAPPAGAFQCLDAARPSQPHPADCGKFLECTPDALDPERPHAVEKACPEGLLYSKSLMVCDWPANVLPDRPECKNDTAERKEELTTIPVSMETSGTVTPPATTRAPGRCPRGQLFAACAFPCDHLCDHFKKTLMLKGECGFGKKCVEGCVDESVANIKCEYGSRWRDEKTCVPLKDCTCYSEGKVVKPVGVVNNGCVKCQCLDNALHCDTSECVSLGVPSESPTHLPMILLPATPAATTPTTTPATITTTTTTTTPATTTTTTPATTTTKTTTTTATPPTTTLAPIIVKSTATPLPECSPDRYKNLLWDGEPLPDSSFTASSVDNEHFAPQFAKLNGQPDSLSAGNWASAEQDSNQYIQVELPRPTAVYGAVLQGSALYDQYVTSYQLLYGDDGHAFSAVEGADGSPRVFRGPTNHTAPLRQTFAPFEARFVRVRPLTWHGAVAARLELLGCGEPATAPATAAAGTTTVENDEVLPETDSGDYSYIDVFGMPEPLQCSEPLGLAGGLPLERVEASSNNALRPLLALAAPAGWRPLYSTPGEWVMFDFTAARNVTGVRTRGGARGWVTSYRVLYAAAAGAFSAAGTLAGNFDGASVVAHEFRPPLRARYLKLLPLAWEDHIEMAVEPVGCFEPYPTPTPTPTQSPFVPTTEACVLCPGVQSSTCTCHNATAKYFDGDGCVSRDQCPCVEGFMTYAVGSSFRGADCDECVCKLGGVTDCKPVKECNCAADLVPKLTPSCECLCEPCANGTKICPTSKLCLSLEKWCDGLQDCPDDERECATTTTARPTVITTVEPAAVATHAATVAATLPTTTAKPPECPVVECPPGYLVRPVATRYSGSSTSDLPPPRRRQSYTRYFGTKTGSRSYSKGGYAKGGYGGQTPQLTPVFSLEKVTATTKAPTTECQQFKCIPKLPPLKPGHIAPPQECSAPACPPGYSLKLESVPVGNQCPQYVCVPPPERPVFCNVTGRTFNTFDGAEYKYDVCFHILARDVSVAEAWTVLVRKKCRVDGCSNELLVRQDDQLILVKPSLMIEYDNYEYTVAQTSEICFQKNSFDVGQLGNGLSINSRKYNFTVLYNKDGDVKIGVYKTHKGYVDGLCGFFDGVSSNDMRLPAGGQAASVDEFGRAWAKPGLSPRACHTSVVPPEKQRRAWALCDVITHEPLSKCGKVLNLDLWRRICLEKMCKCTELVVNGTRRTEEQCRCLLVEQMVAECLAADRGLDVAAWRTTLDCPAACPAPLVQHDCYSRACEPACARGAAQRACAPLAGQCFPGCYCPAGTLRLRDRCLAPSRCLDCECRGLGTPAKYSTFEGDELPALGRCTYLASRDRNDTGAHKYEVYATNGPCEEKPGAVCTKAVHLIYEKKVIHVTKDPGTKRLVTTIGDVVVFDYPLKKEWVTVSRLNKEDLTVELPAAFVELTVEAANLEFSVRLPSHVYARATEGLCGVCAGDGPALVARNGSETDDVELYGRSWQAAASALAALGAAPQQCEPPAPEPECTPPPPELNACYNLYNKDKFGPCHALVDPAPFVEACEADTCANSSGLCAALAQYAAACRRRAVCLDWRAGLCPAACEAPFVYRACVDCERTCDNHDELQREPSKCDKQPAEGCFCPEGMARVNNTCIEPSKCFPCDANMTHYAGDEWHLDACSKCVCSKLPHENVAHVSCTTQSCPVPVCAAGQDLLAAPRPAACCPDYLCVPKPQDNPVCEEPKKLECGFGQVLKQKTTASGCKEFVCECKPASECEPVGAASEVELLPGMERTLDTSGCCPRARLACRPEACPAPPPCPAHHRPSAENVTGACCPTHRCELPADKCLVTLEWEAAPKGGERLRAEPLTVLKDLESVWLDGPCRSCRCSAGAGAPAAACATEECPPVASTEQFVLEPRPVPFACCPAAVQVACRAGDTVYRVGENWTSPYNVCESYQCLQVEDGKLEKVTTVQTCPTDCEPGWKYSPAEPASKQCCGKCKPAACVSGGAEHPAGGRWASPDACANYTCLLVGGALQIQASNVSCPEVPEALRKQFVLKEEQKAGQCCKTHEPVACRVGNDIYQEGQTWPSDDPCKNFTCARDGTGRLAHSPRIEACVSECEPGWRYEPPAAGVCCGRCRQRQCVVDGQLMDAGTSWKSADNCTTFSCAQDGDGVLVSVAQATCPDVSACAPDNLVNDTCCVVCREPASALSTCVPELVPAQDTVGLVRTAGARGACVNTRPIPGFRECRGTCASGTLYNNQTGSHDSRCECCQVVRYEPLRATLRCADGSERPHEVASPLACACRACGGPERAPGYSGVKTSENTYDYEIPEIYNRIQVDKRPTK